MQATTLMRVPNAFAYTHYSNTRRQTKLSIHTTIYSNEFHYSMSWSYKKNRRYSKALREEDNCTNCQRRAGKVYTLLLEPRYATLHAQHGSLMHQAARSTCL